MSNIHIIEVAINNITYKCVHIVDNQYWIEFDDLNKYKVTVPFGHTLRSYLTLLFI